MIISNEPGYKDGAFGIRIENLLVETLTAVPIDLALVEASLLGADEVARLNGYRAFVRDTILPLLQGEDADWLLRATRPLAS